MSAFSTLGFAKDAAAKRARENGHSLGPWLKGYSATSAQCSVCGARAVVQLRDKAILGPALTARCKAPVPAPGRAA